MDSEAIIRIDMLKQLDEKLDTLRTSTQSPPDILYHYTTAEGLEGILSSGQFRATSIYHLNDSSEIKHGLDVANNVLNKMIEAAGDERRKSYFANIKSNLTPLKELINVYVVCFCKRSDLLGMWRAYALKGYCIGFRRSALNPSLNTYIRSRSVPLQVTLEKVEYKLERQESLLSQLVEESLKTYDSLVPLVDSDTLVETLGMKIARQVILRLARFKQSIFKEEREWRFIIHFPKGLERDVVKFKGANGRLVPYLEIDSFEKSEETHLLERILWGLLCPNFQLRRRLCYYSLRRGMITRFRLRNRVFRLWTSNCS